MPIADADLIRHDHPKQYIEDWGGDYCRVCRQRWPCTTIGLLEENERLRSALRMTGGLTMLAQCPCCRAERTNGERHDDDCPLVADSRLSDRR